MLSVSDAAVPDFAHMALGLASSLLQTTQVQIPKYNILLSTQPVPADNIKL